MHDLKRPLFMASAFVVIGVLIGILLSANFGITQKGTALDIPDKVELGSNEEIPEDILNAKNISEASIAISKEVRPAVVSIATTETIRRRRSSAPRSPFHEFLPFFREPPEEYKRRGLGSGIIVSKEGYILTNNHVVKDADKILVTLIDKREFKAKVIGRDELTEVAVVKIEPDDLPVASLGDSEKIQIGEWVLAIGNPMALTSTVTGGVISALGRDVELIEQPYSIENFIQTDAVINPGNSGGPLVNLSGEVIGINTAIQTERSLRTYIGYGFAIPINLAKKVMEDLITHGRVVRGFLGIAMLPIDEATAKGFGLERPIGVLIDDVFPNTPADKAGLKVEDVIVEIDGQRVDRINQIQDKVARKRPGDRIKIKIIRDADEKTVEVVLGEKEDFADVLASKEGAQIKDLGLSVRDLTREDAQRYRYEGEEGVIVNDVARYSPAYEGEISRGDIILEIGVGKNKDKIKSVSDFEKALEKRNDDEVIVFRILRDGRKMFKTVELPQEE